MVISVRRIICFALEFALGHAIIIICLANTAYLNFRTQCTARSIFEITSVCQSMISNCMGHLYLYTLIIQSPLITHKQIDPNTIHQDHWWLVLLTPNSKFAYKHAGWNYFWIASHTFAHAVYSGEPLVFHSIFIFPYSHCISRLSSLTSETTSTHMI